MGFVVVVVVVAVVVVWGGTSSMISYMSFYFLILYSSGSQPGSCDTPPQRVEGPFHRDHTYQIFCISDIYIRIHSSDEITVMKQRRK